jgi:hypothetical protein
VPFFFLNCVLIVHSSYSACSTSWHKAWWSP